MWRTVTSALLITLACLLAPLSATAVWASRQISDTGRYLGTVAPLANDPAVQKAVADAVSREILAAIDRRATTQTLAGLEGFVRNQVGTAVASAQFAAVWRKANLAAHAQLVSLLEGEQGGALSAQNDKVMLSLAPIIALVKERLVAGGFSLADRIPVVDRSIVLVQSHGVTRAQGLYRLLNTLGVWLPVIALFLFAAGLYAAQNRRRALLLGSLGVAGAMLAMGVGLAVARVFYLNALPAEVLSRDAGGAVFDTIVRYLSRSLRAVGILALIVALAAYLAERSRSGRVHRAATAARYSETG